MALTVVDTSAVAAILFREPEAEQFAHALAAAPRRLLLLSAVTRAELSIVIEARKGEDGRADLERLLREGDFEIAPVTARDAEMAIEAFRRFGKGRHRAGLNIDDCFPYALAKATREKLLFKGDDFGHTDIPTALAIAKGPPWRGLLLRSAGDACETSARSVYQFGDFALCHRNSETAPNESNWLIGIISEYEGFGAIGDGCDM